MIREHLLSEGRGRGVGANHRQLAGLEFEHVARSGFREKILSLRRDANQGIHLGLFGGGLGESRRFESEGEGRDCNAAHGVVLVASKSNYSFTRVSER
jgi:hypothetical protein